tara:strand:- start:428 stop:1213 length:786 start_codon:yes stop_codon:yes gene_type:complete
MATYFIYPTDGPETYASVDSGSVASGSVAQGGGVYTSSSSKVTSDEQLIDGNLSTAANFTEQHATIRVDKGSGSIDKIDSAAYYSTADDDGGFKFFTNTASDNATTTAQATIAATVLGWNVDATMTIGNSKRFWYMSAHEEAVATVTQVILGTKLSLTNVGLSGTEGVIHENTMITSQGGVEYSNKKHDGKKFWSLSLKFVSSAYKASLEVMREAVNGSHNSFLYYDGNAYNYVNMSDDSLRFQEVAYGVYDSNIKLTEVL